MSEIPYVPSDLYQLFCPDVATNDGLVLTRDHTVPEGFSPQAATVVAPSTLPTVAGTIPVFKDTMGHLQGQDFWAINTSTGALFPEVDNSYNLGTTALAPAVIYAHSIQPTTGGVLTLDTWEVDASGNLLPLTTLAYNIGGSDGTHQVLGFWGQTGNFTTQVATPAVLNSLGNLTLQAGISNAVIVSGQTFEVNTTSLNTTGILNSGTYTPSYSGAVGLGTLTAINAFWINIGGTVYVCGQLTAVPSSSSLQTFNFNMTLPTGAPAPSVNFTAASQLVGTVTSWDPSHTIGSASPGGYMIAVTPNSKSAQAGWACQYFNTSDTVYIQYNFAYQTSS